MAPEDLPLALAQMPAFLAVYSISGKILWCSRVSYGLDRGSLAGQPSDTLIVEEDRPAWWAAFRRALNLEQAPYSVRVRVPTSPGEVRLAGWLSPVVAAGGDVKYVCSVCREAGGNDQPPAAPPPPANGHQLVTLNQIAAIAHRRKKSLRRYVNSMPPPVTPGRRGHAARWRWSDVRGWVEQTFGLLAPERFPTLE